MELVTLTAETTLRSRTLPFEEILIVPMGDFQYGSIDCDVDRIKRHVEWAAKQKNAYFLGLGDYCDFGSPSNRGKLKSLMAEGTLYDTTEALIDQAAEQHLEELEEILAPTKGRWLGLVKGHHTWEYTDGTTSDTRLCQFLDAPYLGTAGLVEVKFRDEKTVENHRKAPAFRIFLHHGIGSGKFQASPLNTLEHLQSSFDEVDVFLMGHHHKKAAAKKQRLRPVFYPSGRHKLEHRNIILACTGGFLKGYTAGRKRAGVPQGGYVEERMLAPVALGGIVIWARPRYHHAGYATVDLDVSI